MSKQGGWWLNYLPPWRLDNLSEKGAENFRHNERLNYLLGTVNYIGRPILFDKISLRPPYPPPLGLMKV